MVGPRKKVDWKSSLHPRDREGEFAEKLDGPDWLTRVSDQLIHAATGGRGPVKKSAPPAKKHPAKKATPPAKKAPSKAGAAKAAQDARVKAATRERVAADMAETRRQQEIASRAPAAKKAAAKKAPTPRVQARAAYVVTAEARPYANAGAELAELVAKGADNKTIADHLRGYVHVTDPDMAEADRVGSNGGRIRDDIHGVADLFDDGQPDKGRAAMLALLKREKLASVGTAGARTGFDPDRHEHVGDAPAAGARVLVVRPGVELRRGRGDTVTLFAARVTAPPAVTKRAPAKKVAAAPEGLPAPGSAFYNDAAIERLRAGSTRDTVEAVLAPLNAVQVRSFAKAAGLKPVAREDRESARRRILAHYGHAETPAKKAAPVKRTTTAVAVLDPGTELWLRKLSTTGKYEPTPLDEVGERYRDKVRQGNAERAAQMEELQKRGFVRRKTRQRRGQKVEYWELTDAGRKAIDDHDNNLVEAERAAVGVPTTRTAGRDVTADDALAAQVVAAANADPSLDRNGSSETSSDALASHLAAAVGYDGPPKVATSSEFRRMVRDGEVGTELWRGVVSGRGRTPGQIHRQFRAGDYWIGQGVFGNGMYMAATRKHAKAYGEITTYDGNKYTVDSGYRGTFDPESVAHFGLRRDAKVVDWDDLLGEYDAWHKGRFGEDPFYQIPEARRRPADIDAHLAWQRRLDEDPEYQAYGDLGRFAMARGYDAIFVPEGTSPPIGRAAGGDQYVVLNRTALVAEVPDGTGSVAPAGPDSGGRESASAGSAGRASGGEAGRDVGGVAAGDQGSAGGASGSPLKGSAATTVAEAVRRLGEAPTEADAVAILAGDPSLTAAKLRLVAAELGIDVPDGMRAKSSLQLHIAEQVARGSAATPLTEKEIDQRSARLRDAGADETAIRDLLADLDEGQLRQMAEAWDVPTTGDRDTLVGRLVPGVAAYNRQQTPSSPAAPPPAQANNPWFGPPSSVGYAYEGDDPNYAPAPDDAVFGSPDSEVRKAIEEAWFAMTGGVPGSWASLEDVRTRLGARYPFGQVGRVLRHLNRERDADLLPELHQSDLTQRERDARVNIGGRPYHEVGFDGEQAARIRTEQAGRLAPGPDPAVDAMVRRIQAVDPTVTGQARVARVRALLLDANAPLNGEQLRRVAARLGIDVGDVPSKRHLQLRIAQNAGPPRIDPKQSARDQSGLDTDIRQAYRDLQRRPGDWVPLARLRERIGGDRAEQDAALERLALTPGVQIIPWDNRKALTPEDHAAALRLGGQDNHAIRFDPPADPEQSAHDRQSRLDSARTAAEALVDLDTMAANGGSPQAVAHRVDTRVRMGALTEAEGERLREAFHEAEVENSIRTVYRDLAANPNSHVMLADVRDRLPGISDEDFNAAVRRLARAGDANLVPQEDQKRLTTRLRGASVRFGDRDNHMLAIEDPFPTEPRDRFRTVAADILSSRGATTHHTTGDVVPFDASMRHQGDRPSPGAPVQVVSPGATLAEPDGNIVTLTPTVVMDAPAAPAAPAEPSPSRPDLDARLADLGRRIPADPAPLDRAARALDNGTAPADVAKQLRADAASTTSREDAETLRLLATNVTRPRKEPRPAYLGADNSIDLEKFGAHIGADISPYLDPTRNPMPLTNAPLEEQRPYAYGVQLIVDDLQSGKISTKKAIALLRAEADTVDRSVAFGERDIEKARAGHYSVDRRTHARVLQGPPLAAALRRIADELEAAKIGPRKRGVTLAGTTLGEIVPVDEDRFAARPLKGGLVRHRGQPVPESLRHSRQVPLATVAGQQLRPGLTDDENIALDLYTGVTIADRLNGSLRQGRNAHGTAVDERVGRIDLDEIRTNLDSAIANSELSEDSILWRGALARTADLRRLVPGAIYRDGAYLSTSTDEGLALRVVRRRAEKAPAGKKPVIFKLLAPAGTHGALGHEDVSEVVLGRGQEFRVVRVDDSGDIPIVVMEAIPPQDGGFTRGRDLVNDYDYSTAPADLHVGSRWTGRMARATDPGMVDIQREQGFDGPPQVVSRDEMDDLVAGGAVELWRGLNDNEETGTSAAQYAEEYRTGTLTPRIGVFGSGTYAGSQRGTADTYGGHALRMAIRRDARVIRYSDLVKLYQVAQKSKAAADLDVQQREALASIDPSDTDAIQQVLDRFAALRRRQGGRARMIADMGRFAALLGYDVIYEPAGVGDMKGKGAATEYVILNRTATYVQEA